MLKRSAALVALFSIAAFSSALAADKPKLPDKPQGAEVAFVAGVQKDLSARFATPADAEKAGYFRFNNEDSTGAISYVNLQWNSSDPQHPSQLWYDVKGNLLGADYSRPDAAKPPSQWGVNPQRWFRFNHAHIHYIYTDASGMPVYGHAVRATDFTTAGGSLDNPTAAALVKTKGAKVSDASKVTKVFTFPSMWDLELWVTANPNGAFAAKNPLVKPSANAEKDDM